MSIIKRKALIACLLLGCLTFIAQSSQAQERLCDTSFEDCRQPLWSLIDNERTGIDFSFWFIQDTSISDKLIARFRAGVPVRVLCDPRANPTYSGNQAILDQLQAAGIPMRYKVDGGILHMKFMLFAGQNRLEFSGANYSSYFFVPIQPYVDYFDEAIYFTDDPALVNSFKTQMDNLWTDTINYANYANISGPLTRRYPTYPIDPALNFPPSADGSQDFYNRTASQIDRETQKIDIIMYRLTNDRYTNTTIAAKSRGIPVRLLTEQDEYRNPARQWDAYNVDLLYNAGVQIRLRNHQGLNHEKAVILYGQAMTIFGSSNWTGPSSNSQQENNYFTTKPWFFNWFVNHFERKWNSTSETKPFVPLPPDPPSYRSPANAATGQPLNVTLTWEGGPWAHKYDIYLGTDPNPPLIATDRLIGAVDDGVIESYTLPPLQSGTKYYWRIVGKTMANVTASGPVWSFTTGGTPPPNPAPTISSISPGSGSTNGGTSVTITGTGFRSGATVSMGGAAATSVNVTSSTSITAITPAHAAGAVNVVVTNSDGQSGNIANGYTYTTSTPPPSSAGDVVLYASEAAVRVGNYSVVADGSAAGGARIFNPDAGAAKLASALASPASYFEMTFDAQAGTAYRLWIRGKAQNNDPFNDSVFVQFSDSITSSGAAVSRIGTTSSEVINLEDCSGCGLSEWGWQDNGWGIGAMGPLVYFQTSGSHTLRIQPREDGLSIDQIVLSASTYLNTSPGTLMNDSTILPKTGSVPPASVPTVSGVTPNSGPTGGGTAVAISGSGFAAGAAVRFGGVAAGSVNVISSTSITAITPAHAAGAVNVVVTNPDNQSGTLTGGYTYTAPGPAPAPTINSINPSSGTTSGGTSLTITGTGFSPGARVTIGGVAATSVIVVSSTSITAITPSHAEGLVSVSVTNSDGQSATRSNAYTYIAAAPVAPSNLTAIAISDSQINLSWSDGATTEAGFKIERSSDGLTFTEINTVGPNTTTYSDTGLRSNRTYYYRVRAFNSGGNSAYSNVDSARTPRR
ncbi:MAG TPA: IPT/TIG domain-containing protein [Blastocatellia bacterium]|jgi:hypothetical protein|nr:IPT/TIG domain-containing protein [Blastocatellia bacterium]